MSPRSPKVMDIITKLLGKRSRSVVTFTDEIATQEAELAASLARIESAKADRQAAIEALNDEKHEAADNAIAAAQRDVERRHFAIAELKRVRIEQADVELRESFHRDVARAAAKAQEIKQRLVTDYTDAAATIAALARDIAASNAEYYQLAARGKQIGEEFAFESPESFRGTAPGLRGRPTPPVSLAYSIGDLPGLLASDSPIRIQLPSPTAGIEHLHAERRESRESRANIIAQLSQD